MSRLSGAVVMSMAVRKAHERPPCAMLAFGDLAQRHPENAAQRQRRDELHHRVAGGARRDELHVAAAVVLVDLLEVAPLPASCALNTLMTRWPSSASLVTRVTSPIEAWMRAL